MKRNQLCIVALSVVLASAVTVGTVSALASNTAFSGGELAKSYTIYDTLTLPSASFGGVTADAYLTYPDGNIVVANGEVTLDQGGVYELEYRATVEGQEKSKVKTFTVDTPLFSLSGDKSTAVYGKDENDVWSHWNSGREGIMLSLAPGETFRYNDVFNVYDSSVANYAFQFAFAPEVVGRSDAQNMYVTFTDIYDENNQVTVWLKTSTGTGVVTYIVSKANEQPWVGYEVVRGTPTWHINNQYGSPKFISSGGAWYGTPNADILDLGMFFKKEEQQLFLKANRDAAEIINNDFDDISFQTDPWGGFTTGEVYMSLHCENYNSDYMNLLLMNIGGQDLSRESIEDKEGPTIHLKKDGLSEAEQGKGYAGMRYPVAEAAAVDTYSHGTVKTDVRAYYNYSRITGEYTDFDGTYSYELPIKDGYIQTQYPGNYAICYRSVDWYGNKTEKVVSIKVENKDLAPKITGLTLEAQVTQGVAGNVIDLPFASGHTGGSGALSVQYEVYLGETQISVLGDVINGTYFVPKTAGEYTVNVIAEDVLGQRQTESYTVEITASAGAGIDEKAQLPDYLFANRKYVLPTMTDSNGKTAKIVITDGAGTRDYKDEMKFTPDENGNATITYKTADGAGEYSYTRSVLTVEENWVLKQENYFLPTDGVQVIAGDTGMLLTANKDGKVTYAKAMLVSQWTLQLYVDTEDNAFRSFAITLTDAYDKNIAVRTEFTNEGVKNCGVSVNGEETGKRFVDTNISDGKAIAYSYNNTKKTGTIEQVPLAYDTTLNGAKFEGFPSGMAYVNFEFIGVEDRSVVEIATFGRQRFNKNEVADTVAPAIAVNGSFARTIASLNETIDVYTAVAVDILDPYTTITVSVTHNNKPVTAVDGTTLSNAPADREYQVLLNDVGQYDIRYTAKDSAGKTAYQQVRYTVYDDVAPNMTIDGTLKNNHSIGEISLPKATATDNVTETPTVYVTVTDPYGYVSFVEKWKFTAEKKGMYTVRYVAYDEAGNVACREFTISVS
ncbi:MAG: hypothetical protein IJX87_00750 [Clostridia bacterium]|nr:hypothetical protein [Clostridia bacterium]